MPSTFALTLTLGALIGLAIARLPLRLGARVDLLLSAGAGAIIGGRALHVLLNWDYFALHPNEAFDPRLGGLSWHGALLGGVIGLALFARLHRLALRPLLNHLAPALPLIMLAGWFGCATAACGYGAEVATLADHPPLVAVEARDVFGIEAPRWNTHLFGALLALIALAITWRARRFEIALLLVGIAMLTISFFRGDAPSLLLDGVVIAAALSILLTRSEAEELINLA